MEFRKSRENGKIWIKGKRRTVGKLWESWKMGKLEKRKKYEKFRETPLELMM